MRDRVATFIVGEGNWLPLAMGLALIAVAALWVSVRDAPMQSRQRILAMMNLFTGVMLVVMGAGHLLAVTVKQAQGTLRGSALFFYAIGLAVVLPAWFVVRDTRAILAAGDPRRTVTLNAWMAVTLVVLGLVNLPLALPALGTIGYSLHRRRWVGWAIVALVVAACGALLVGGLIFMASGQTFEDFSSRNP